MLRFVKKLFTLPILFIVFTMAGATGAFVPFQISSFSDPLLAKYTGANGIEILSYHPQWTDQDKLKTVWDELMRNEHFEEIELFNRVKIYQGNYSSMYYGGIETITWPDGRTEKRFSADNEIIYFPDSDVNEENAMAVTLAHEYGHHFTIYHLFNQENIDFHENWQYSRYAKLRGLLNNENVNADRNAEHKWQPVEIATSDYIQLFGSPNARKIFYFDDQPERTETIRFGTTMYNIYPQENIYLPLAAQTPGLYEYWLQLAGQPAEGLNQAPTIPVLALTRKRYGEYTTPYYTFQWSRSLDDKDNPLTYTLLEYRSLDDRLGQPIAVVTDRYAAERLLYVEDSGIRYYRLLVSDPEGFIVSSNILKVNLDHPDFQEPPSDIMFRDVRGSYWAESSIRFLVEKGILQGYTDNSFKPENRITRAEFAVILCKALGIEPAEDGPGFRDAAAFSDTAGHWAGAYITAVKEAGLIQGYNDNTFGPDMPISRAETAVVLGKALEVEVSLTDMEPGFVDIKNHWAEKEILQITGRGIMSGYPNGTFNPEGKLTRAEAAAVLARAVIR
ncbi:S-layer homology domain-containing protein [Phosphitispora sp. TUW77]|uniref:S-layer homology domain-containing protein n=1 Tax=Phosphitispora sp. TUW77 TaxID=3152361 RepID=UPI003AB2C188